MVDAITETSPLDVATWRTLAERVLRDRPFNSGLTGIPADPRLVFDGDWIDSPRITRDAPIRFAYIEAERREYEYLIRIRCGDRRYGAMVSIEALNHSSIDLVRLTSHQIAREMGMEDQEIYDALSRLCYHDESGQIALRCNTQIPFVPEPARGGYVTRQYSAEIESDRVAPLLSNYTTVAFDVANSLDSSVIAMRDLGNSLNEPAQNYITEEIARAFGVSADLLSDTPEAKQRIKERAEADTRAKQMLVDHLDDEQKSEFNKNGHFRCVGKTSGDVYQILSARNGNVLRYRKEGKPINYCLVQKNDVPLCDQLLTQKLLIENNEEMFLEKANNLSEPAHTTFTMGGVDITGDVLNFRFSYGVGVTPAFVIPTT